MGGLLQCLGQYNRNPVPGGAQPIGVWVFSPSLLQLHSTATNLMHCSTFPSTVWDCTDENDCISWAQASYAAKLHGLWDDFRTDYGTTAKFGRVDAGEFLQWLGY